MTETLQGMDCHKLTNRRNLETRCNTIMALSIGRVTTGICLPLYLFTAPEFKRVSTNNTRSVTNHTARSIPDSPRLGSPGYCMWMTFTGVATLRASLPQHHRNYRDPFYARLPYLFSGYIMNLGITVMNKYSVLLHDN